LGENESGASPEIERYAVWPGQATSYMVGKIKIMELRDRAKAALGSRFDLRAFHDAVLLNGSLPLAVLRTWWTPTSPVDAPPETESRHGPPSLPRHFRGGARRHRLRHPARDAR
jgi:hypothetical protein